MKRSKILGMCKAAESWLRDSQLFLEKLVSKNSIQLIFLSKTILRMESVTQQQRWRCPFKHLVAHFPLLCWCLFTHLMFDKASSLNELGYFICGMACKQKPVSRLDLVGKSHECQGVTTEGKCHPPTDNLWRLFHVIDGSNGKTPVGYRAPEMRTHEVVPKVLAPDIVRRLPHQRARHGRARRQAAPAPSPPLSAPRSPMTPSAADGADTAPARGPAP